MVQLVRAVMVLVQRAERRGFVLERALLTPTNVILTFRYSTLTNSNCKVCVGFFGGVVVFWSCGLWCFIVGWLVVGSFVCLFCFLVITDIVFPHKYLRFWFREQVVFSYFHKVL